MPMDTLDKLKALASTPGGLSDAQQCMRRALIIISGGEAAEEKFVRLASAMRKCEAEDQDAVIEWLQATMPPKGD